MGLKEPARESRAAALAVQDPPLRQRRLAPWNGGRCSSVLIHQHTYTHTNTRGLPEPQHGLSRETAQRSRLKKTKYREISGRIRRPWPNLVQWLRHRGTHPPFPSSLTRGASKSRDAPPSLRQRQLVYCLSIFRRMLCWVELCGLPRLVSSPRGVWTSPPPTPASHPDGCQGRHKATYYIVHKAIE